MKIVARKLFDRLVTRERQVIEIQNSSLCLVVGIVFLLDGDSLYSRFPDTYRYMEWLPSAVWGAIYTLAGVAHLAALYFGWRMLRKHILLVKCGLWVFLAYCVVSGDPAAVSGYFYVIFAFVAMRAFFRIQVLKIEERDA
jgi:hypothetical protein